MLNATVVKRVNITDSLFIMGVKPDFEVPNFLPGQYVALGLPASALRMGGYLDENEAVSDKILKRTYSIGSSPDQRDLIEFYVAVVPTGILTPRLQLLKEGDRVYIAPKVTGKFTIEGLSEDKNLILISTGTGIAPYISMIRTENIWTANRKITLLHGVRYTADLAYAEELKNLQNKNSNFSYYTTVSRAEESYTGEKGYVQKYLKDEVVKLNPEKDHVFLCGNPAMIDELESYLCQNSYTVHSSKTPGNLHLEKYW